MLNFYWDNCLRQHWVSLVLIVVLAVLAPFLQIANIGLAIPLVTLLMGNPDDLHGLQFPLVQRYADQLAGYSKLQVLMLLMSVMAALLIAKNAVTILRYYTAVRLLTFVRFSVTKRLLGQYLHSHYGKQVGQPSGAVLHHVWESPIQVAETVRAGSELLAGLLQFLALVIFMTWLSWPLTLITSVLAVAAVFLFDNLFRASFRSISDENYSVLNQTMAFLSDAIAGIRQIKAHVAESQVLKRFDRFVREIDRLDAKFEQLRYWPAPLSELFLICLMAVLVLSTMTFAGLRMDLSYLVAFMLAIVRLGPSINAVMEARVKLHAASRSVKEVLTFEEAWVREEEEAGRRNVPARIAELRFDRVSFVYPSRPSVPVLREASLCLRVNEITALVGVSGAGKSTVADLLIRLFQPSSGTIQADGVDIREFDLRTWRRQIGFVSQDTFLFNASIRENIALADPTVTFDTVKKVAQMAHIHEFVQGLPDGYDTAVGDRGMNLSGGQKQRIAIARALLTGAQILVFDEATSSLDGLSEKAIHETLNELRAGRIIIVIAHRLSTIVQADKIAVLERGRVVEEGSHQALVQRGRVYAGLFTEDARARKA